MPPHYSPGSMEPSSNVTPVTSTFSLLMKIVRNLALKRDDPEGREQHKRFVEQQFISSNIRIDRAIDECGSDLTQLIKLFDLILRRIDRSRHELSEFLFSVQNCKNMLLVQRSDCRKLWFQLIGQKTMLATYEQIIEVRKVRSRCRVYVGCGYFMQAAELLSKAKDTLKGLVEKLGLPPFDMFSTTIPAMNSLTFNGSAKKSLLSAYTGPLVEDSSSLPATRQDSGSSQTEQMRRHAGTGLAQVNDELNCAITEMMNSLKLALEICVFGSTSWPSQQPSKPFLAENRKTNSFKSPEMQSWWKRLHCGNVLSSGATEGEIDNKETFPISSSASYLDGFQYSNSPSMIKISIPTLDSNSNDPKFDSRLLCLLSSGLSFERLPIITNDRPCIFSLETDVDNHEHSLATYSNYIVKCAEMLPIHDDSAALLQNHMADILPSRLDHIALFHAKCISAQSPFILRHFDAESSALINERTRHGASFGREFISPCNSSQGHLLSVLLVRMFDHYKHIAQSYKVLISCLKPTERDEKPTANVARKGTDTSDDAVTRLTTDLVWASIQKPLTVALLAHVVDDMDSYSNKQELLALASNMATDPVASAKFNSNLILMLYQRINSQPMVATVTKQSKFQVEKIKKAASGDEDLMDTSIMLDDLSLDIDLLFLSQTPSFTGLSSYSALYTTIRNPSKMNSYALS